MARKHRDHVEQGESVRSIRDWAWMKEWDNDDGGIDIIYDHTSGRDSATETKHGHYAEDSSGNNTYNRPPA